MVTTTELPYITKTLIPRQRNFIVRRDRILEPMLERVDKKVQTVCAPAGYGKTALLAQFSDETELPICWYSFSPEDHDPISILRYCIYSIRAMYPDFGASCISLLKSGANVDLYTLAGLFITELHSNVSDRLVYVFDDVHWTDGKADLEEILSLLIERAPRNVHFIIGSRTWPSLPCLAKLTSQDELDSIDADDLRFSAEETEQLLANIWNRQVKADEVDDAQERTGGWAAAIMLLAKSQGPAGVATHMRASDQGVLFDYLTHEVFALLPESLQAFLLRASVIRDFTARMCDRILEISDSTTHLQELKARGLFLEERGSKDTVYKFHDLFKEYLARRLQADQPKEFQTLHKRAAAIYSQMGDDDAAVFHFLQSGEPEKIAEMVKAVSATYYAQGRWEKLAAWLSRIPRAALENEPDLLLLNGQVLLRLGDPTGSLEELDKLVTGRHSKNLESLGKALVAKSTSYRRLGHFDQAVQAAEEGLLILKGLDCLPEHVAEGYKQLGDAFNGQAEYDRAEQSFLTGLTLINKENLRLFSLICNDLGGTYLEQGNLDQAVMYLEQARVGLAKLGNEGQLAETLTNLALVYYHKGEFDLALDEVNEALRSAQATNYFRVQATALMQLGMVQRALGAYTESVSSSSRGLELARQILDQRLIAETTEGLGNAYRLLGDNSKAEVLLNEALLEAEASGQKYIVAIYHISLGKAHLQTGSHATALDHLRLAEQQLTGLNSSHRLAETKLIQAAIHYRADKHKEAVEELTQVGELVSKLGYDGWLLAYGAEVIDVLRFGAARRLGGEIFPKLVARLTQTETDQKKPDYSLNKGGRPVRFPAIRASSFGYPRVFLDIHEVTDGEWRSRKAKELFFFLICNRQINSNERIMEALWPEVSVDLSNSALKTNIYRLRQALFFDCILSKEDGYCINPEVSIDLDMENFILGLKADSDKHQGKKPRAKCLVEAIDLYEGPFLDGISSDWCQDIRSDLEIKHHGALMQLAASHASDGDHAGATGLLESAVAEDPYHEEAQYQLVTSYLDANEPFVALERLRKYTKVSLEELGASLPSRFEDCQRRIQSLM